MKLTKENYEFLMFELLEGNLNRIEKNALLEQINKDTFYKREWMLMQHAVATPDTTVRMDKRSLLKPEGRKIAFISFTYFTKIAASLLLIATAGWWYYTYTNKLAIVYTPVKTKNTPETQTIKDPTNDKNSLKQIAPDNRKAIMISTTPFYLKDENPVIDKKPETDSLPAANLPEILLIKPMENEGIAYDIKSNEVTGTDNLITEKPKTRQPGKISQLLARADEIRTTTREYWNDIPNLKFRITPGLKDKKRTIGFELKGETIYAYAILEIK